MTPLACELKKILGDMEAMKKIFSFTRDATSQLGEWCADQTWRFAFAEEEVRKIERIVERPFLAAKGTGFAGLLDDELKRLRKAQEIVSGWEFCQPLSKGKSLSPKVQLLKRYLHLVFEKPSETKCIIFVKRRYAARLLEQAFKVLETPHMRTGLLIGTRYGDPGDLKISFRQQVLTLMKFKKGEINCLVRPLY